MSAEPALSLIIPTHNRAERLRLTLAAVAGQGLPAERLEVIVVDDGGADATAQMVQCWPSHWRCVRQGQQGATHARNRGAAEARGQLLVFMDDDIELGPAALETLARLHGRRPEAVIVGTLLEPGGAAKPPTRQLDPSSEVIPAPFAECYTGLLSVGAAEFAALGGFQDVTGGWPNWDDVYFGYRAQQAGLVLLRSPAAWAVHHDVSARELMVTARRSFQAGRSAARLFAQVPAIRPHLPMFADKTPVDWRRDGAGLIARKTARRAASAWPVLRGLAAAAAVARRALRRPALVRPLERWVIGGYIYQGYHQGLKDLS